MKIEQLERYVQLKIEIRNHEDRIAEIYYSTVLPAMRQSDGSKRQPGHNDQQEKANIRYMEIKDELQQRIDANKEEMRQIRAAVDRLEDPLQREVLRIRFIDGDGYRPLAWADVAMRMYGDDDQKDIRRAQRLFQRAKRCIESMS